jgi:predicted P-loop ATPase
MAPHPEYFVEIDFSKGDDDIVRKMRGKCVLEIAELKGLSTKDAEHIKGFITVRKDEWIPKYREFATKADRRSMFFGTTNQDEFLSDPTGNRRHLPIEVGNVDNDAILRDNNQLWAEGAVLFRESGVAWQDAIELAKPEVEKFEVKDVWQEAIQNWISAGSVAGIDEKLEATDFTTSNILTSAVGLVVSKQGRREQLRVSGIMEKLGYKKHQARVDAYGGRAYLWYLPCF